MDDDRPYQAGWTSNDEIAEMLDVTTAACTLCGDAARVPEDVVAIKLKGGESTPIVICIKCRPEFAKQFHEMIDRMQEEKRGR